MSTQRFRRAFGLGLALVVAAMPSLAGPLRITIDTTPLQSQGGFIAFDFVTGNPAPPLACGRG